MDWLAYAHPLGMSIAIVLGLLTLREGLALRRARLHREPANAGRHARRHREPANAGRHARLHREPGNARRHARLARVFVVWMAVGWVSGLVSMTWLRDWPTFESVHGWIASAATLLAIAAGALGLRLERGRRASRSTHVALGAGAVLLSLAAAIAALAILP